MRPTLFVFGEAEKGDFRTPYECVSLCHLAETFGNPPEKSRGIDFAIQALLYQSRLFFFRVEEEGFSLEDYFAGAKLLENRSFTSHLSAIGIPGMGNPEIVNAMGTICSLYGSLLLIEESDLYDYLTH